MITIVQMVWQPVYVNKSSGIHVRASQLATSKNQESSEHLLRPLYFMVPRQQTWKGSKHHIPGTAIHHGTDCICYQIST